MNLREEKYKKFSICHEMLETCQIIKRFNPAVTEPYIPEIEKRKKIFITGEGSSRIFPSMNIIYRYLKSWSDITILSVGATQAMEYDLTLPVVFGLSNSGKTKELITLFKKLKEENHPALYGISANQGTPLQKISHLTTILTCGKETAVAATKSVMEQALFFDVLLLKLHHQFVPNLQKFSDQLFQTLTLPIDQKIIQKICRSSVIYFAGRNNGVAEELTLKTYEISKKKALYLEGTFAVHGIEEVMNKDETIVIIDPFESEEAKFKQVLEKGVGLNVVAISTRQTSFPTIIIPDSGYFTNYLELAAGWNLLVEIGLQLGVNLDKGTRARKIGNEINS